MANQMNTHTHTQIERLFKLISESHDFQLNLDYIPGTPVLEFFFFIWILATPTLVFGIGRFTQRYLI